jgi:hypothetical protein
MSTSLALNYYSEERDVDFDSNAPVKPERNLLAAVLARAICDAFGTAHCERHIIRSARQWLFGKLSFSQPFSFAWVATHLDLDPISLQENLKEYNHGNAEDMKTKLSLLR